MNTQDDTRQERKQPIHSPWVVAKYTGDQAKRVAGLAHAGVGYFVLEKPEQGDAWITVAFVRSPDTPDGDHLMPVLDHRLIEKLDMMRADRMGTH